jgi:NitT/TauT family transport system permease protein
LIPGPAEVLDTLYHRSIDGSIAAGAVMSLRRLVLGFGISVGIGAVLGLLTARFGLFRETVGVLVLGLQALPSICWLPLALVWFGLNESAILFVVVMGSLLSVAIAADEAVRNIPVLYLRAARNMGAQGITLYGHVVLPAAFPTFLSGLKQGWSFAWRALMAGELLFVGPGLGRLLMMGRELNDMSQVIGVMLVIVALGLFVDRMVFGQVEKRLRRAWGPAGLGGG